MESFVKEIFLEGTGEEVSVLKSLKHWTGESLCRREDLLLLLDGNGRCKRLAAEQPRAAW